MFFKSWLLLMTFSLWEPLALSKAVTIYPELERESKPYANLLVQYDSNTTSQSVLEVARQVSVRILSNSGTGSGVIIKRQGSTYTVLTNYHVVADNPEDGYRILTPDGQTYQGKKLSKVPYKGLDIALLQFNSSQNYQVATTTQSNALPIGHTVYASGFPAWQYTKQGDVITSVEETQDWGIRAFKVTTGTVEMFPERMLLGGYQIGYTNQVTAGMSGGPLLNQKGELIGINGKLKHPMQGIQTFIFDGGIVPSEEQFQQMDSLSWAIPVARFQELIQ